MHKQWCRGLCAHLTFAYYVHAGWKSVRKHCLPNRFFCHFTFPLPVHEGVFVILQESDGIEWMDKMERVLVGSMDLRNIRIAENRLHARAVHQCAVAFCCSVAYSPIRTVATTTVTDDDNSSNKSRAAHEIAARRSMTLWPK